VHLFPGTRKGGSSLRTLDEASAGKSKKIMKNYYRYCIFYDHKKNIQPELMIT
jgi:hypothetical protein